MIPPRGAWRVPHPTSSPGRPLLDGLVEQGSGALPVRITIVQEGVRTGWDDGALGFEEDAVWFSGRACSFRITAADLLPMPEFRFGGEGASAGFLLRHPTRRIWVDVAPLAQGGFEPRERARDIAREIARLRSRTASTAGSQYPPLAPRPGLLRPLPSRRTLLAVSIGLLVIAFVALFSHGFYVPAFVGLVYTLGLLSTAWSGGFRREELVRIAREEAE